MAGKKFNNYVLDLISNEDFNSNNILNSNQEKEITTVQKETISKTSNKEIKKKETLPPKETQSVSIPKYEETTGEITDEQLNKYYSLISSSPIILKKDGVPKEYLEGTFCDKDSNMVKAIINPIYAEDFFKCNLGSQFILELKKIGERLFIEDCKYIFKQLKKEVA